MFPLGNMPVSYQLVAASPARQTIRGKVDARFLILSISDDEADIGTEAIGLNVAGEDLAWSVIIPSGPSANPAFKPMVRQELLSVHNESTVVGAHKATLGIHCHSPADLTDATIFVQTSVPDMDMP